MLAALLQQAFDSPEVDFHAFAPELVLTGAIVVVLVADLFTPSGSRGIVPQLAGIGILAAFVPVLTLAVDGVDRVMFDGAYTVDNFALVLKGCSCCSAPTWWCSCRRTTSPRATTPRASTTSCCCRRCSA